MKVEFLQDYRGWVTQERFFQKGAVVDLEEATAKQLIKDRRAVSTQAEPSQELQEAIDEDKRFDVPLVDIPGIGEAAEVQLQEIGIVTAFDLAHASPGYVARGVSGMGEKKANKIITAARELVYEEGAADVE